MYNIVKHQLHVWSGGSSGGCWLESSSVNDRSRGQLTLAGGAAGASDRATNGPKFSPHFPWCWGPSATVCTLPQHGDLAGAVVSAVACFSPARLLVIQSVGMLCQVPWCLDATQTHWFISQCSHNANIFLLSDISPGHCFRVRSWGRDMW